MQIETSLLTKQIIAFDYLLDKKTVEIFYGGGAGGGKSFLGCFWLVYMCLKYKGTRYLMGRASLKTLKQSTLLTLFDVLKIFKQKKDVDWKYNSIEGIITFKNKSTIYLKDLFLYPSDPEFDSLGSTEYTSAFIDEVSEITEKAKDIVRSRVRYKLEDYNLTGKILYASNPAKNWAYKQFYIPYIKGELPDDRKFIPALVGDNSFMSKQYEQGLLTINERSKQRLLYGNWEYDDDLGALFEYDDISYMFENDLPEQGKDWYISADIAGKGKDMTVICVWRGLVVKHIIYKKKTLTTDTEAMITHMAQRYGIPMRNVVIDYDGLGMGVGDHLKCVTFVNNSRPYDPKTTKKNQLININYANLKSQCYFKLAKLVRDKKISIRCELDVSIKQRIIEDLEQIKEKGANKVGAEFIEKEGKLRVLSKEEIKIIYGKSPDFADALMMRMIFEVKPKRKYHIA